jgi:hypothetical protein
MTASILAINSRDSAMAFSVAALASANSARPRRTKSAHSRRLSRASRIVSCVCEKSDCGMCRSHSLFRREQKPLSATDARWPLPVMKRGYAEPGDSAIPAGAGQHQMSRSRSRLFSNPTGNP